MTLEQIKECRALYGDDKLFVFSDNAKLYNTQSEQTTLIWDDANELLHTLRPNSNYYSQSKNPVIIETAQYDAIQYIGRITSKEETKSFLEEMKSNGLVKEEEFTKLLEMYKL